MVGQCSNCGCQPFYCPKVGDIANINGCEILIRIPNVEESVVNSHYTPSKMNRKRRLIHKDPRYCRHCAHTLNDEGKIDIDEFYDSSNCCSIGCEMLGKHKAIVNNKLLPFCYDHVPTQKEITAKAVKYEPIIKRQNGKNIANISNDTVEENTKKRKNVYDITNTSDGIIEEDSKINSKIIPLKNNTIISSSNVSKKIFIHGKRPMSVADQEKLFDENEKLFDFILEYVNIDEI